MASDDEEVMPPAGSAPPTTTSAGTAPPATGTAITTAAPSGYTTQALVVPIQQQPMISGPPGALSGGGYITNLNPSSITTPVITPTDTTALANILSSGVLPPVLLADLQLKCAVLNF